MQEFVALNFFFTLIYEAGDDLAPQIFLTITLTHQNANLDRGGTFEVITEPSHGRLA